MSLPSASRRVDVVVVERPDVAVRAVRPRRAAGAGAEGRGVEDAVARREEVGAGRLALAVGDAAAVRAVRVHREDLVARQGALVGLEDQPCSVGGPVGLGVLSSERQLPDVGEVLLLARGQQGARGRGRRRRRSRTVEPSKSGEEERERGGISHAAGDLSRGGRSFFVGPALDLPFSNPGPRFARPGLDAAFSRRVVASPPTGLYPRPGRMERDSDLRKVLAEEIRAAIADTAPEPGAPARLARSRDGSGPRRPRARLGPPDAVGAGGRGPGTRQEAGDPRAPLPLAQPVGLQRALARRLLPARRCRGTPPGRDRTRARRARAPRRGPGDEAHARRGARLRDRSGPGLFLLGDGGAVPAGRRLRALRRALPRESCRHRAVAEDLPRVPQGRSGSRARRRMRSRRISRGCSGARAARQRASSPTRSPSPHAGPRASTWWRPTRSRRSRAAVRLRPAPWWRSRSSSTGRRRRSSAFCRRRAGSWRPAACSSPRPSTPTRSAPCGRSSSTRRTSVPFRRRRCSSWPRRRVSRTPGSSTGRRCPPPNASRSVGERPEAERAALRRAGLRARRPGRGRP